MTKTQQTIDEDTRPARTGRPAPSPGSGIPTACRVFATRAIRHSTRDVESMLMAVLLPVLLMLMFTYVFGGAIAPDGHYLSYVVPGIVLTCAGYGAATTAVGVARDMSTGTVNRLRTMPTPSATILVGHVVASLLRNLCATGVVLLVAVAIGFRPQAGPLHWLAALGMLSLYILAITAVFAMLGLVTGSPEAASGYGFLLLFLPYVSSAFVPVATMPSWLQGFAGHQPVTPVIEATRALFTGSVATTETWLAIGWCGAIITTAVALTTYLFPRRVTH